MYRYRCISFYDSAAVVWDLSFWKGVKRVL